MNINRPPMLMFLAAWGVLCLLVGCAAAPIQQMSDARQSLQAAHAADADIHAPGLLKKAESDLSDAELSLARHEYSQARDAATNAKREAVNAKRLAVAIRDAQQAAHDADMLGLLDDATTASLNRVKAGAASTDHPQALLHRAQGITLDLNKRVNRFYMDKAKPMIDAARDRRPAMNEEQRRQLDAVEQAYQHNHGKTAYDGVSVLLRELDKPESRPPGRQSPVSQSLSDQAYPGRQAAL